MFSKIKHLKINRTSKIGLYITLYFLILLILQELTYRNVYIDFISPYPQPPGHITGDIAFFGIRLIDLLTGLTGLIVFYYSKRNTPLMIQIFLFLTGLSGLLAIGNLPTTEREKVIFYTADIILGTIAFIGIILLQVKKEQIRNNTP